MATLNKSIEMTQRMSVVLQVMNKASLMATSGFERMQTASRQASETARWKASQRELYRMGEAMAKTSESMEKAAGKQELFNKKTTQGVQGMKLLKSAMSGLGVKPDIQKVLQLSDSMARTKTRLSMVNDGQQSTGQLQNKIFASANRSGASYTSTANTVSDLSLNAGASFKNNDETIAFVEQANKQFALGGASAEQQTSAMDQLSQAMAEGSLKGDALNTVLNAAPGIGRSIEQAMGWAEGSIRSYAEQGAVTAQVVKNSLFAMQDQTNASFGAMGMTWQQVGNVMSNKLLQLSMPLLDFISTLAKNWNDLEPIILGVAAAIGAYMIATNKASIAAAWQTVVMNAQKVALAAQAIGYGISAIATGNMTFAQMALNTAMAVSPIVWLVLIIGILVALIAKWVQSVGGLQNAWVLAIGYIMGALFVLGAFFMNNLIGPIWNVCAALVDFLINVFTIAVSSIKNLFYDMGLSVLEVIQNIANSLQTLMDGIGIKVNITTKLDKLHNRLEKAKGKIKDESQWKEYTKKIEEMDYGKSWKKGVDIGQNLGKKGWDKGQELVNKFSSGGTSPGTENYDDMNQNVSNIANNTGTMADSMSDSQEDMTYLRDIAEREAINRFTTAEIKVEMSNSFGDIRETADVDGIIGHLTSKIQEQMAISAEGVYI